jgi:homoserine O-acetyltransferase/O-succinyltransferase
MKTMSKMFGLLGALFLTQSPIASAHWPDQSPHQFASLGELKLEHGGVIPNLKMSYVTHGKLNAKKDNAIMFLHGFGMNHHQADHLLGPGKPLDINKYFIICPDELGNTQTTFEHSTSPSNSGLKMKFPAYNARDMNSALYKLVIEGLKIPHLLAISGISMGADHSVQFAVSYSDFVDGIFPISGGALWGNQGYFYGAFAESIIQSCAGWDGGNYNDNPKVCAANGLSALIPYFYTRDWWERNIDSPEAYQKWRNTWGEYYLDIQDARDLYYLYKSGGLGWIGDTPGFKGDFMAALKSIKAKTLFIYNEDDQFMPPEHIATQVKAIPNSRAVHIPSLAGHLICCNAEPQATSAMGEIISQFLSELYSKVTMK